MEYDIPDITRLIVVSRMEPRKKVRLNSGWGRGRGGPKRFMPNDFRERGIGSISGYGGRREPSATDESSQPRLKVTRGAGVPSTLAKCLKHWPAFLATKFPKAGDFLDRENFERPPFPVIRPEQYGMEPYMRDKPSILKILN